MKNILFVCVGNSGRSQIAEALFNHLAQGKARATAAGPNPANIIDPKVVQIMKEVGLDISSNQPKKLTVEMLDQADKVVTMGCGAEKACPASLTETEDWELEDPKGQSIARIMEIRAQIKTGGTKLVKDMQL